MLVALDSVTSSLSSSIFSQLDVFIALDCCESIGMHFDDKPEVVCVCVCLIETQSERMMVASFNRNNIKTIFRLILLFEDVW